MALNDLVLTNRLLVEEQNREGEDAYLFRLASSHLIELVEPNGLLAEGIQDWPEVQEFIANLARERQDDLNAVLGLASNAEGSLGHRLRSLRNRLFHYPHLHAEAVARGRLEVMRALESRREDTGSLTVRDGRVGGIRAGFADEIALVILDLSNDELERLVIEVRECQLAFIRFAEAVLHHYFEVVHGPSVVIKQVEEGDGS